MLNQSNNKKSLQSQYLHLGSIMKALLLFLSLSVLIASAGANANELEIISTPDDSLRILAGYDTTQINSSSLDISNAIWENLPSLQESHQRVDSKTTWDAKDDLSILYNYSNTNYIETPNLKHFLNHNEKTSDYKIKLDPIEIPNSEIINPSSDTNLNLNYIYESRVSQNDPNPTGNSNDNRLIKTSKNTYFLSTASNLDYLYKSSKIIDTQDKINPNEELRYLSNTSNYLYDKNDINNIEKGGMIKTASKINKSIINYKIKQEMRDPYISSVISNLNCISSKNSTFNEDAAPLDIYTNLNSLVEGELDNKKEVVPTFLLGFNYSKIMSEIQLGNVKKANSGKNYAVVVGINDYLYRPSLHTCANDAHAIADILKSYGYEVIELTDKSENKPTKHNILEGALAEIETTKNRGKVIFYFSGHGDLDKNGNFYLLPQDANDNPYSYICKKDIDHYLKDVKNLAIIIDACNSGAFSSKADDGQLIITSSRKDEPSNEAWMGSLSVFTHNLCTAIMDASESGNKILLQRSFCKASKETIKWSRNHWVSQTPCLIDKTNGQFYLN